MTTARPMSVGVRAVLITSGVLAIFAFFLILVYYSKLAQLEKERTKAAEFWISTNTASGNLGTLDNPFICAAEPEFDRTMSHLPPDCTVHILPGIYHTLGGSLHPAYSLKSGQKILGSGMEN